MSQQSWVRVFPPFTSLGVQISKMTMGTPGRGQVTCRQPLVSSQRGQPAAFLGGMLRRSLPPAEFAITSLAVHLALILPELNRLNSPEGFLGKNTDNESQSLILLNLKKVFLFLNSGKQHMRFLLYEIHAWKSCKSKDKRYLNTCLISEG